MLHIRIKIFWSKINFSFTKEIDGWRSYFCLGCVDITKSRRQWLTDSHLFLDSWKYLQAICPELQLQSSYNLSFLTHVWRNHYGIVTRNWIRRNNQIYVLSGTVSPWHSNARTYYIIYFLWLFSFYLNVY